MLTGWTNANEKKFKSLYNQIIGHPIGYKEEDSTTDEYNKTDMSLDTGTPHTHYENRTKDQVYNLAKELDIDGRSYMNKSELIEAVREIRH